MTALSEKAKAGGDEPPAAAVRADAGHTIRVWDPVVRLFHWSLVAAFVIAWATGDELQRLHEIAGYAILGLLVIRVVWGFVGTTHARFSDFVYRPSTVISYLIGTARLRAKRYVGHNPAGGAMVIALLVMLAMTCATGIMMTINGYSDVEWVEDVHEVAANLTVVLVGFHLAGVFVASIEQGENLLKAMITGRKSRE